MYQRMRSHYQESPHIFDATGYLALFDAQSYEHILVITCKSAAV